MRRRYEVWFVRCGLADGSGAWWFRYLLVNNLKIAQERSARRHFQVWATWFPHGAAPQTFIVGMPLEQLNLSARGQVPFHCRAAENGIEDGRCWGNVHADGHHISWNLRIHSHFGTTLSDKGWLGFSRSPHSDATFSGEIIFDGRKIGGEPLGFASRAHNPGTAPAATGVGFHDFSPHPTARGRLEAWTTAFPL